VGVFHLVDMRWLALLMVLPLWAHGAPRESSAHASSNGVWSIQMVESAPEQCRLEATRDADPAWTLERCVGTVQDLYFISDDGQRFWVLRVLPRTPPMPKSKGSNPKSLAPGAPFTAASVAALYDRQGNLLAERTLKDFLKRRFDKLRDLDTHFCWLEGELGVPGRRPRITDTNQVEFETVEPKTFRLDF
jgi:hypothetical protein